MNAGRVAVILIGALLPSVSHAAPVAVTKARLLATLLLSYHVI